MYASDGTPMEACENFTTTANGDRVAPMASTLSTRRKTPRTPAGCEGHLTRQQAAQLLGFSSEFKIRQLERDGRLQSVRGPMKTAFYARADVLAVKAELEQESPGHEADDDWTDAQLLELLRHPTREGQPRTPLDLVLETHISIDRAEKVYDFWTSCGGAGAAATAAPKPSATPKPSVQAQPSNPATKPMVAAHAGAGSPTTAVSHQTEPPSKAPPRPAVPPAQPSLAQAPAQPSPAACPPETATQDPKPVDNSANERRGEERLSRDALIAELRHPDPRVRERAFARLKEQGAD
jgi:hypothetical protein